MDRFDRATRSRVMSRARSTGGRTTELRFRSLLVRSGTRGWVLGHRSGLPGAPDILFLRSRLAVFLDGCFWHGCRRCRTIPATNHSFWAHKIQRNRERDRRVARMLRTAGWRVIRIWEHELKPGGGRALRRVLLRHSLALPSTMGLPNRPARQL